MRDFSLLTFFLPGLDRGNTLMGLGKWGATIGYVHYYRQWTANRALMT
jgi:hypothetical protein